MMLVANEAEFIKHKEKEYATESEKQINELCENFSDLEDKSFTKTTKEYLSKKEKTISDTIQFVCDFENSLKSIISTFANTTLSLFADDKCVKEIKNICEYENNFNLSKEEKKVILEYAKRNKVTKPWFEKYKEAIWIKPELIGTAHFMHETENGGMRQPVWKGLGE